ncbi:MAG: ubiE [Parachlamydiales bacterium]|nr:ubiE [Parachlamydiales bacterium]
MSDNHVLDLFNRISQKYDRTNRLISLGLDMRWRRTVARHLPTGRPLSLLDLATGTGDQIAALLNKKAPIKSAIGIDISEEMLQIARKKIPDSTISFQCCDAEELPFSDHSFDVCTFSFGIRNVKHPLTALTEMFRVAKPNGRCLILEFSVPRGRIKNLYLFYLRRLMPLIGATLSQDMAAYRYLNQTIEAFPSGEAFLQMMRQTGWKNLQATQLLFGCVTLYRGEK